VTLLDKYGLVRTSKVIQGFYEDVLQDPKLGHFFDRVGITELAEHQTVFLNMVMGGTSGYTHHDIEHAHSPLGINHEQFEAMIGHLEERLANNEFDPEDVARIIAIYRVYEPMVTGHPRG
jgi:truncated hemoglobin YjbI